MALYGGINDLELWGSPIKEFGGAYLDIADHRDNEYVSYSTYSEYRELANIMLSTGIGIGISHLWVEPFFNVHFPIHQHVSSAASKLSFVGSTAARLTGWLSRATAAGVVGVAVFKMFQPVVDFVSDEIVKYRMDKKLVKRTSKLFAVNGEVWESYLQKKLISQPGKPFDPVVIDPHPKKNYQTAITNGLFRFIYAFKYAVEEQADFYRGEAEKIRDDLAFTFMGDYVCAGLSNEGYLADLRDLEKGVSFEEGHLFLSRERAEKLAALGVEKRRKIQERFKADIVELAKKIERDSPEYQAYLEKKDSGTLMRGSLDYLRKEWSIKENLNRSLMIYKNAIDIVNEVAQQSGRHFLLSVSKEFEAAMNRSIYSFHAQNYYEYIMAAAEKNYEEILVNQNRRQSEFCFTKKFNNLREKYIYFNSQKRQSIEY